MISNLARCSAEARSNVGYHSSGVAIFRPSAKVTTSSVAVNSTARARRSPTSISKMVIPGYPQSLPICAQVANDIANFMRGKAHVGCDGEIVNPDFDFLVARTHVNMGWLISLV